MDSPAALDPLSPVVQILPQHSVIDRNPARLGRFENSMKLLGSLSNSVAGEKSLETDWATYVAEMEAKGINTLRDLYNERLAEQFK